MLQDRKDMLVQVDLQAPKMPKEAKKLEEESSEGFALKVMTESRGWKILLEKFIKPRSHVNRILAARTTQERHEACGAVAVLQDLTNFVEGHIKEGYSALSELETLRKEGRQ